MFSPFLFQTTTNASLLSLQNAINPLNQSQRTIPQTVDSNRGALNTPGIQVRGRPIIGLADYRRRY